MRLLYERGTGAVRHTVHALRRRSPIVPRFRLAAGGRGGGGATLVVLLPCDDGEPPSS